MQTIGERLEEARKKKGVSIREAAEATKIRGDYLQKFESNQFDIGLTEIYTRGFLRTYANFLKIPAERIMSDYAALGRGDIRPRQPNREIYGRMDITVASAAAAEGTDRGANPGEAAAAEPEPASQASRSPARFPRTGTSLPSGPDPAVLFKWAKIAGAAVAVILLVSLIWSFFSSRGDDTAGSGAGTATATRTAAEPTFALIASNPVHVTVQRQSPEGVVGETVFSGTLARGESRTLPWTGWLRITATVADNVVVEVAGRRHPIPLGGGPPPYGQVALPAPKQ